MRLERLSSNSVKFSISISELESKGILEDEQWKDSLVWHDFFEDLMDEMYDQYGLDMGSTVTVEINSFNSQEMVLILTLNEEDIFTDDPFADAFSGNDETLLYQFRSFEDVLSLMQRLNGDDPGEISLYSKNEYYYLEFMKFNCRLVVLASEYGEKTKETIHTLNEYGKKLISKKCKEILTANFGI